jgi:signal transduction histidine kinase
LAVPIFRHERVIGVLNFEHDIPNYFSEDLIKTAESIAGLAVIAIDNILLYNELNLQIQKLEIAQKEIADKERILVLTSVAADFIHRMNNIAGTIPHWVDLAKRQLGKPERSGNGKAIEYLDNISEDAKLVLDKVKLLNQPLKEPEPINICDLIESIVAQMEASTPPGIQFITTWNKNAKYVAMGIEQQLSDVFFNIIDNAMRSMEGDGEILISMQFTEDDNTRFCEVRISDNGIGIPSDLADKIFELGANFWSTGEGMGYGLWRARNIIESLGGSINFETKYGGGSTFIITLPAYIQEKE